MTILYYFCLLCFLASVSDWLKVSDKIKCQSNIINLKINQQNTNTKVDWCQVEWKWEHNSHTLASSYSLECPGEPIHDPPRQLLESTGQNNLQDSGRSITSLTLFLSSACATNTGVEFVVQDSCASYQSFAIFFLSAINTNSWTQSEAVFSKHRPQLPVFPPKAHPQSK